VGIGRQFGVGGGATQPLSRDGGVEELHGDPTVGPRLLGLRGVPSGRQVRLLCPWATHLTELPLPLSGKTGRDRWQLDSIIEDRKGHFAVSWSRYLDKYMSIAKSK